MTTLISSWQYHKELKSLPTPTYREVVDISQDIDRLDIKALFIMAFETGARISELCGKRTLDKKEWLWLGLLRRNINIETDETTGENFLVIKIHNSKYKKVMEKILQIPIYKEKELLDMLEPFLNLPQFDKVPTKENPYPDMLFPMDRRTAYKYIKGRTGFNPHFIRVIRAVDLVVRYDLNDVELVKFMGWSSAKVAMDYANLRTRDMRAAMLKVKGG